MFDVSDNDCVLLPSPLVSHNAASVLHPFVVTMSPPEPGSLPVSYHSHLSSLSGLSPAVSPLVPGGIQRIESL